MSNFFLSRICCGESRYWLRSIEVTSLQGGRILRAFFLMVWLFMFQSEALSQHKAWIVCSSFAFKEWEQGRMLDQPKDHLWSAQIADCCDFNSTTNSNSGMTVFAAASTTATGNGNPQLLCSLLLLLLHLVHSATSKTAAAKITAVRRHSGCAAD